MGNGRGKIDCVYCVHFAGSDQHEEARRDFHGTRLPPSDLNRICCHFEANALLADDSGTGGLFAPAARQFGWFAADLEPGVLYEFMYNDPPSVKKLAVL